MPRLPTGARRAALVLSLLVLACGASAAAESRFSGRPLGEVLRDLSGPGIAFVFSSDLVPESLQVTAEPPPGGALATARALLAQHGLALRSIAPGIHSVVRGPRQATPATAASAEDADVLRELVVSASRYRIGSAAGAVTLEAEDLTDLPGVGDDPIRNLARLPGIVQDGISARSNVRGGEADEVLLLLDGFPLRRAFHLASYQALFSVIDSNLIRGADIWTGGFPVRYGNRMSAVFDLQTVEAGATPARSAGIDFFNASLRSTGPAPGGLRHVAAARVGTLQPLLQAFAPRVGQPRYADVYGRLEGGDADGLAWSVNALSARDELQLDDRERGEVATSDDRARYLWARVDLAPRDDLSASAWLGQTHVYTRRVGTLATPGVATGSVRDARAATLWDFRSRVAWEPAADRLLEGGLEITQESASYRYAAAARYTPAVQAAFAREATLSRQLALTPSRLRTAAFLAQRRRFAPRWTVEAGWRTQAIDGGGEGTRWVQDPRLSLRWERGERTWLHLTWGRFHQVDEVQELKVEDGLAAFPSPQRSEHVIIGVEPRLPSGLLWRVEAFSKRQSDPRARFENFFDRRTLLAEIAPDRTRVLPDYAELRGLEGSLDWHAEDWSAWAGLSWTQADDEQAGNHVPRSWDVTFAASAGARWTRGAWAAQAAVAAHRGFPTSRFAATAAGPGIARNAARLPAFVQLDLRVQHRRQFASGELVSSFELINTTNHLNACCQQVVAAGDGTLALRRQGGLPLFPSLGVRWNW